MSWIAKNASDASFVLKVDTDAHIINPFVRKLNVIVKANPEVGMFGAYTKTPNGSKRDWTKNAKTAKELHTPPSLVRRVKNKLGVDERAIISRHFDQAVQNGYEYGEHCLGGAYALSAELLKRMLAAGYLEDPALWLPIDCPEDVMVGMYTKAVGMRHMNYVSPGEVFGVRHKGLPDSPEKLVEKDYSVIHALKNDPNISEEEIRGFYKRRREA
jgi:hypothetical protein